MSPRRLALLKSLLAQPTAPFREAEVVSFIARTLDAHGVPHFLDPVGNLVVGCASRTAYARLVRATSRETLPVFIAHMDHPGFHGARWVSATRLRVKWHGGSPVNRLIGAPVWLAVENRGSVAEGRITKAALTRSRRALDTAEVIVREATWNRRPPASALYGGFHFRAPVWQSGKRLYTKAADDLVGVFAVVCTAIDHFARAPSAPFLGLLTRAEEVGFIGAIGHFELGWLKAARRPIVCVSLETSRTLPGALIGKGPVVRLGDRRTVFAPDALNVLAAVARRALPEAHQRRVMDGGTCEATAATVYGFDAVGISVPLGNYHNQGFEGGPDSRGQQGPAPEFVHLDDIDGLLSLCRALARPVAGWRAPWAREQRAYRKRLREYRSLLKGAGRSPT
jgi:endoglucanase